MIHHRHHLQPKSWTRLECAAMNMQRGKGPVNPLNTECVETIAYVIWCASGKARGWMCINYYTNDRNTLSHRHTHTHTGQHTALYSMKYSYFQRFHPFASWSVTLHFIFVMIFTFSFPRWLFDLILNQLLFIYSLMGFPPSTP